MASRQCLNDVEASARRILPSFVNTYVSIGADGGQTVADNSEAFKRIRLRPRLMRDVSERDTSTIILGEKCPYPIAISPTALHNWVHPEGERATAKAAESMNTGMVVSLWSGTSLEEIAECAPSGLRWMHLEFRGNRDIMQQLVNRAENNGCKGLFVTLDMPVKAKKRTPNFIYKVYERFFPISFGHFKDTGLNGSDLRNFGNSWEVIDWLKSITRLPIVAKGILTAEDAREAVKHGVAGILVSNHGGRQLDGVLATIDALPEVVQAVKGTDVEVYMDGGVRLGTDVLKALALGAKAVFIGRPILWGLALDGEIGVTNVIRILQEEFDIAMALSGCRSIDEIDSSLVQKGCTCSAKL